MIALALDEGPRRLAEFLQAPAAVQREFWAAVARRARFEHRLSRYRAVIDDPEAPPPISVRRRAPRRVRWEDRWRRRVARARRAQARGWDKDREFEDQREHLLAVEPEDYVAALTGEVPNRARKIPCPLPSHDERTGSFHVYEGADRGWYCYGCHRGGTVYDLAAALWGMPLAGRSFVELHNRLMELFG